MDEQDEKDERKKMTTTDMIRILQAGGSLHIDCKRHSVLELIRLSMAMRNPKSMLVLENPSVLSVTDRIRISMAGKGVVLFNEIV